MMNGRRLVDYSLSVSEIEDASELTPIRFGGNRVHRYIIRSPSVDLCCQTTKANKKVTLVRRLNSDMLLEHILNNPNARRPLEKTKQMIIRQFNGSDKDDMQIDALKISLMDPLMLTRIKIPSRTAECTHLQSFDLNSYLMMCEQQPAWKWKCPVCNKDTIYSKLIIDAYFEQVLSNVGAGVDEVELLRDGTWRLPQAKSEVSLALDEADAAVEATDGRTSDVNTADDDDDIMVALKQVTALAQQKRVPSAAAPPDLDIICLSSDDEDEDRQMACAFTASRQQMSAVDGAVRGVELSGSGSAGGTSSSSCTIASSSLSTSANTSAAAMINEVVEKLCTNVSELRAASEQNELRMQQAQTTSASVVVVVDDHLQQREADEIDVEPAADHQNGSGNNEADEMAKLRFGIVERVEIPISNHGFEIGQKMWVKRPCQRKGMDRRCKTKTKVNNAAAKSTKRTSGVDAGAEQGKRLHRRSDFDQVMASLMRNSQEDPIYRMCLQLPGMPNVTAHLIFQINQFLCQFISFIPKEALGEIDNKHSFTLFNTSIVKKALQERETPQLLEDKMMFTLATTVKYAQNYAQCQEGISYAMRTFQNVAEYLEKV
uniref:SP-RING-type domain-containing protein n=1 Tax=Globodera rostochiensis TaxID=31243 RepID=A0A914HUA1_GLORO